LIIIIIIVIIHLAFVGIFGWLLFIPPFFYFYVEEKEVSATYFAMIKTAVVFSLCYLSKIC